MKTFRANLLSNSPTNVYDKTKTFKAGLMEQKTLPSPYNGTDVIAPPLTNFLDVFTDTLGAFLPGQMYLTANNRLFILMSAPATGVANQIAMYNFNSISGAYSYVGRIAFSIASPAAISVRGFKVDDSSSTNIKIFLGYTSTTATSGGLLMINKVQAAHFVPSGFPTFFTAIANDVAAVYHLVLPLEVGGQNTLTNATAVSLPGTYSANGAINTKVYCHNGISATHQFFVHDYAAAPQMASLGTSTVTAANTTGVSTTFTMTGNTLAVSDSVVITSNAPTAYTVTGSNTVQTVYYVVAANFVAGSTFSLSLTLGGAIVNGSTAVATTTFVRALGQCSNLSVAKTANLQTLGAGTLLQTNSENFCVPASGANSGQDCVFVATTTNFLRGKLSDLYSQQTGTTNATINVTGLTSTAGLNIGQTVLGSGIPLGATIAIIVSGTAITLSAAATTSATQTLTFGASLWPSLESVNVLGNGIDYVVPVPLSAAFDSTLDKVVYLVAGSITMVKAFVNSMMLSNHGSGGNSYMEAQGHITNPVQLAAISSIEMAAGWIFYSSFATVGQRGIIAMHLRSDSNYDYSYIISPVTNTTGQILRSIGTIEQLFDYTGGENFYYRTAATSSDALFNTAAGGWIQTATAEDLNVVLNNFTQFKVIPTMTAAPDSANVSVTTPPQIVDIEWSSTFPSEISDNWDFSYSDSSTAIPTRSGFIQRIAYSSSVPVLYFRAYDTDNNLVTQANTVTNAGNFQYSTDDGGSWNPLGTIPNVVGTRIRYTWTTPPGVDVRVSVRES